MQLVLGAECEAFKECGYVPIGIDLNPGSNNKYVVYGDFHNIQYNDNSFDVVFTNSLDHVYDLSKVLSEAYRVTRKYFISEFAFGSKENNGLKAKEYETIEWDNIDDIINVIHSQGFQQFKNYDVQFPWDNVKGKGVISLKNQLIY